MHWKVVTLVVQRGSPPFAGRKTMTHAISCTDFNLVPASSRLDLWMRVPGCRVCAWVETTDGYPGSSHKNWVWKDSRLWACGPLQQRANQLVGSQFWLSEIQELIGAPGKRNLWDLGMSDLIAKNPCNRQTFASLYHRAITGP